MKRTFILMGVCVSLIGLPDARGQSTLNAAGGTYTLGSTICDWSIGEMSMVATFYGSSVIATQGVLQNEIMIRTGIGNINLAEHLQVFPNPASTIINLQYTAAVHGVLGYQLMDMAGRVAISQSAAVNQGVTTEQLDIATLAAATYLLEVSFKTENNKEETTSYKIEKLK